MIVKHTTFIDARGGTLEEVIKALMQAKVPNDAVVKNIEYDALLGGNDSVQTNTLVEVEWKTDENR